MSHNTADLAGLMLPPQLFQTESRSLERLLGLISTSLHKFSFLAAVMMDAMVVRLTMHSNRCQRMRSLMRLAPFTEPEVTITDKHALP